MQPRTISIFVAALAVVVGQSLAAQESSEQQASARPKGDARDHVLHPWALNEFIEYLGGRRVTLLRRA